MLKKVSALLLAVVGMQSVCLADNMKMEISADNITPVTGSTVNVSFDISGNKGFNNYTFFIDYDKDFYELVSADTDSCIKFGNSSLISESDINKQMNVVPQTDDSDFEGLGADGIKTASELGRIKLAGVVYDTALKEITDNGSLLKLSFKIKGDADTNGKISVVPVDTGFNSMPVSTGDSSLSVLYDSLTLTAKEDVSFIVDENGTVTGYKGDSATELNIPSEVDGIKITSIGGDFIKNDKEIKKVVIPDGVTSIGDSAFKGCSSLDSVSVPESVKTIGNYAFSDCSSLTNINIPKNLETLGKYAFKGCSAIKGFDFQ
jgi:hypothetical protein